MGYSFSMVTSDTEQDTHVKTVLHRKYFSKCLVVVDCSCEKYDDILLEASQIRYFNQSYTWLVLDRDGFGLDQILGPLLNISVNSDVTFASQRDKCNLL